MSVRNSVDKFLANPNLSAQYKLNSFHREILRVIARYCDMYLGYCCLSQEKIAIECGMSIRECKNLLAELSQLKFIRNKKSYRGIGLIFKTNAGRGNRVRIGEIITGISNENKL